MKHIALAVALAVAAAAHAQPIATKRSLIVTDPLILEVGGFTLKRVFAQLREQGKSPRSSLAFWQQWWDTQQEGPGLRPANFHCDDEQSPEGAPAMNGFPIMCPRAEAEEIAQNPFLDGNPGSYHATALVNRFDLAPVDGGNCGEYRIVFAKKSEFGERNFLIFEAVMPNPTPAKKLAGCRPIAEFWAGLSEIEGPGRRAQELKRFYFEGLFLGKLRLPPVIHVEHYGRLGGQIRTNQFMQSPWLLKQFELAQQCTERSGRCQIQFMPVVTENTPFGALFNDLSGLEQVPNFQKNFVQYIAGLLPNDVNQMSLPDAHEFAAGESHSQDLIGDYAFQFEQGTGEFANAIRMALKTLGSNLEPIHVVRRALFLSCGGCHQQSAFFPNDDLGNGVSAPSSLGFLHVDESGNLSSALQEVFLPHRKRVLEDFLQGTPVPEAAAGMTIGGPRRPH
ncbi:MAG: hypothetical protein U1A16_00130 [Patescibacteria group bacterium]|nr:hypothetical protein [Patescibacteria group bacterium]